MVGLQDLFPSELLIHVFSHVPSRKDIAACRRVSKQFKYCSSQFLVPRVVVAKRVSSLKRLQAILSHRYFRNHVTELVWDTSAYQQSSAEDFENYIQACEWSSRDFRDSKTVEEDLEYTAFGREIGVECSPLEWSDLKFHEMEDYETEQMYAAGMHRGFDEYFRLYNQQTRIETDGVHFHMLRKALQLLPNLRRIVFTGFRNLAGTEEQYAELCNRLFGNTFEPLPLAMHSDTRREELRMVQELATTHQSSSIQIAVVNNLAQ